MSKREEKFEKMLQAIQKEYDDIISEFQFAELKKLKAVEVA